MPYHPSKGGHAPDHLRKAFTDWLESDGACPVVDDRPVPPRWLTGQLWNCTDQLPRLHCELPNLPQGATYAQAARAVHRK